MPGQRKCLFARCSNTKYKSRIWPPYRNRCDSVPIAYGIPLAIDATIVSPLHADGSVWDGADMVPRRNFKRTVKNKHTTYPELVDSNVLRLIVVATEVGGQLNQNGAT